MDRELLRLAARLLDRETPYAVATVVRREPPSSAAPGNTALITGDGAVHGWIGGSCTLPEVTRHAIASLNDRQPRLLAFGGSPGERDDRILIPMSCGSEGKVEVHVNPVYPAPRLAVAGDSPIARAVERLGEAMGYRVEPFDRAREAEGAGRPRGVALYGIVATMGRGDEEAVERLLAVRADYVGLVVSPKRMARVREHLAARGVCGSRIAKVRGPAGLDIGAVRPEEVAVSILAEIVALARAGTGTAKSGGTGPSGNEDADTPAGAPATATDPVCGMTVPADGSRPSVTHRGRTVHFCCPGCRARFEADPAAYA